MEQQNLSTLDSFQSFYFLVSYCCLTNSLYLIQHNCKRAYKLSEELKELKKITRILTTVNAEALEKAITKYASTDERKKIWVLIDGTKLPKDMVSKIGNIKQRAIENFLDELEKAQLITNPKRKPAEKLIDYVPPEWIELLEKTKKVKKDDSRRPVEKAKPEN